MALIAFSLFPIRQICIHAAGFFEKFPILFAFVVSHIPALPVAQSIPLFPGFPSIVFTHDEFSTTEKSLHIWQKRYFLSLYPNMSRSRGLFRQSSRTLIQSCKFTRRPSIHSISRRAAVPIFLSMAPPLPIIMPLWP